MNCSPEGTEADFHARIMRAVSGGIVDDLGPLAIGDIQQITQDATAGLIGAGVLCNEPVMVPVCGRAEDIISILAVIGAGGTAVPVHERAHSDTIAHIRKMTRSRFALRPEGRARRQIPAVVTEAAQPPAPRSILDGAGIITFTSGTTGTPKGVVLSRQRMSGKFHAIGDMLSMPPEPVSVVPLQLVFSFGQWASFLTLMKGGVVHLSDRFDPDGIARAISGGSVDYLAAVPTMLRMLLRTTGDTRPFCILTGGEAVDENLRKRLLSHWPQVEIHSIYGLTESGTCDLFRCDGPGRPVQNSLGFPADGIELRTDPVTCELQIRSPFAMLGYLDMPELTAETIVDGWLRTGDMAEITPEGEVFLRGRIKELINRGGNKISPIEVEALFCRHPAVATALATGVPDAHLGEAIHLLIVPVEGPRPDPDELISWAKSQTEGFKLPDAIHVGHEIPCGRTGKADRAELRLRIQNGSLS